MQVGQRPREYTHSIQSSAGGITLIWHKSYSCSLVSPYSPLSLFVTGGLRRIIRHNADDRTYVKALLWWSNQILDRKPRAQVQNWGGGWSQLWRECSQPRSYLCSSASGQFQSLYKYLLWNSRIYHHLLFLYKQIQSQQKCMTFPDESENSIAEVLF